MTTMLSRELSRPTHCPHCGAICELIPITGGRLALVDVGVARSAATAQSWLGRHECSHRAARAALERSTA